MNVGHVGAASHLWTLDHLQPGESVHSLLDSNVGSGYAFHRLNSRDIRVSPCTEVREWLIVIRTLFASSDLLNSTKPLYGTYMETGTLFRALSANATQACPALPANMGPMGLAKSTDVEVPD